MMLQSLLRKLRWPLVASAATVLALVTSTALAGSGVGAVFNLGKTNTVNQASILTGKTSAAQLQVVNTSNAATAVGLSGQSTSLTGAGVYASNAAGGPGLQVSVKNGAAPLVVNSTGQVTNLNASLLAGHASAYYLPNSVVHRFGPMSVSANHSQTLVTIGQLTFVGDCHSDGGIEYDLISIETSANGAAWSDVYEDQGSANGLSDADLLTGGSGDTIAVDFGTQTFSGATGQALSPDGHEVFFDLYMGQNARGATGDNCVFGGSFVTP